MVERKSLADLVATLTGGKLRYLMAELASVPRRALVVEDRVTQLIALAARVEWRPRNAV